MVLARCRSFFFFSPWPPFGLCLALPLSSFYFLYSQNLPGAITGLSETLRTLFLFPGCLCLAADHHLRFCNHEDSVFPALHISRSHFRILTAFWPSSLPDWVWQPIAPSFPFTRTLFLPLPPDDLLCFGFFEPTNGDHSFFPSTQQLLTGIFCPPASYTPNSSPGPCFSASWSWKGRFPLLFLCNIVRFLPTPPFPSLVANGLPDCVLAPFPGTFSPLFFLV